MRTDLQQATTGTMCAYSIHKPPGQCTISSLLATANLNALSYVAWPFSLLRVDASRIQQRSCQRRSSWVRRQYQLLHRLADQTKADRDHRADQIGPRDVATADRKASYNTVLITAARLQQRDADQSVLHNTPQSTSQTSHVIMELLVR